MATTDPTQIIKGTHKVGTGFSVHHDYEPAYKFYLSRAVGEEISPTKEFRKTEAGQGYQSVVAYAGIAVIAITAVGMREKIKDKAKKVVVDEIANGYAYTGFSDKVKDGSQAASNILNKTKIRQVNFKSEVSIRRFESRINKAANKEGLGHLLTERSESDLTAMLSKPLSADQKALIETAIELKAFKNISKTSSIDIMKNFGIKPSIRSINFNRQSSIDRALKEYRNYFNQHSMKDWTKASYSELKARMKDTTISDAERAVIADICHLKYMSKMHDKKKRAGRFKRKTVYFLGQKVAGESDAYKGFLMTYQVSRSIKSALVMANTARKITGKILHGLNKANIAVNTKIAKVALSATTKIVGVAKGSAAAATHAARGTTRINNYNRRATKINDFGRNTKALVTKKIDAKVIELRTKRNVALDKAKTKIKTSIKKHLPKRVVKTSAKKTAVKGAAKAATKVAVTAIKTVGTTVKVATEAVASFATGVGEVIMGVVIVIGFAGIMFSILNGVVDYLCNTFSVSQGAAVKLVLNADGSTSIDQTDIRDSVFSDTYSLLQNYEDAWYYNVANIASNEADFNVNTSGYFNPITGTNSTISRWGEPSDYSTATINNGDGTTSEIELYNGFPLYYYDNDGRPVAQHSNIKTCISLAHGFINANYHNPQCLTGFKSMAAFTWMISHNYSYVPSPVYKCENGDYDYSYKCNENTAYNLNTTNSSGPNYVALVDGNTAISGKQSTFYRDVNHPSGCQMKRHTNTNASYTNNNYHLGIRTTGNEGSIVTEANPITITVNGVNQTITASKTGATIAYTHNSLCDNYIVQYGGTNPNLYEIEYSGKATGINSSRCSVTYHSDDNGSIAYEGVTYEYCIGIAPGGDITTKCNNAAFITTLTVTIPSPFGPGFTLSTNVYECQGHMKVDGGKAICQNHNYCNGHTARLCSGHVEPNANITLTGIEEQNNLYRTLDSYAHVANINALPDTPENNIIRQKASSYALICMGVGYPYNLIDSHGYANGMYKFWSIEEDDGDPYTIEYCSNAIMLASMIFNTNWEEQYGIVDTLIGEQISNEQRANYLINSGFTASDIEAGVTGTVGTDGTISYGTTTAARQAILDYALGSVGRIPYLWAGKTTIPGYAGNNFAVKGLDCTGWVDWVFLSTVGRSNIIYTVESTMSMRTDFENIKPGDILSATAEHLNSYSGHVGMFMYWKDEAHTVFYFVHESGNVHISNCYPNYWSGYYDVSSLIG